MKNTRITTNPNIMLGKPIIKGTRIPVYLILNLLANGYNMEKIIQSYPDLKIEDVQACLEYASQFLKFQEEGNLSIAYA